MLYVKLRFQKEVGNFVIVSAAYIAAYTLVGGFVSPLQMILCPGLDPTISLLFFPHGVRMLAVYFYGWKSVFLLLPSSYLMWYLTVFGTNIPIHPLHPILSLFSCASGYYLLTLFMSKTGSVLERWDWKLLIFAGVFGSFFNGVSYSIINTNSSLNLKLFFYMAGDIFGQIALMLLLLYLWKLIRLIKAT